MTDPIEGVPQSRRRFVQGLLTAMGGTFVAPVLSAPPAGAQVTPPPNGTGTPTPTPTVTPTPTPVPTPDLLSPKRGKLKGKPTRHSSSA